MASNCFHGLIPGDMPKRRAQHSVQTGQVQYILHETRGGTGGIPTGKYVLHIHIVYKKSVEIFENGGGDRIIRNMH